MRDPKTEAAVLSRLIANLRAEGWWARKLHGNEYSPGWPDVCVIGNGRTCWVETKRPPSSAKRHDGGKLSPVQAMEFGRMARAGAVIFVGDDADALADLACGYLHDGDDGGAWNE